MIENCETPCTHCQAPIKFGWDNRVIVPPGAMLIADWMFHVECWKDPEPYEPSPELIAATTVPMADIIAELAKPFGGQMEGSIGGTNDDIWEAT